MICGLPGEERPVKIGKHSIERSFPEKTLVFDRCPWAGVATDAQAGQYLRAYWMVEDWREWPPGRRDPRLYEALSIIKSEHRRIDEA